MPAAVLAPFTSRYAPNTMVCTVDNLATEAGVQMMRLGGSAVDAALAASAVLTVTLPNQCGLGGDLFALVHRDGETPLALNATGRAGSGADPDRLRAEGHRAMPARGHVSSVTVPGCADGWLALHGRLARLDLREILAPAIRYAREGFPASPYLARAVPSIQDRAARAGLMPSGSLAAGQLVHRPGAGRLLGQLAERGRPGFYEGEFGEGLLRLGEGEFSEDDLRRVNADWVQPLSARVWGHDIWTVPPNSQGYLVLSAAWIAERLDLPEDPADPLWAHLLIEAARQAAHDRPWVLHEDADGPGLLSPARLAPRVASISREHVADLADSYARGGTTYICAVDGEGTAVSLIQSNAMSFGSHLAVPGTGVFLHNRGIGFSLSQGHPAEYGPGRRPPHTLAPALVTEPGGRLRAVLGTRGGDSQPQVLLQLLARLLRTGQNPAAAVAAGRWVLRGERDDTSFGTWGFQGSVRVSLEGHVPMAWRGALGRLGHRIEMMPPFDHAAGHAQVILASGHALTGAADPRALAEATGGF